MRTESTAERKVVEIDGEVSAIRPEDVATAPVPVNEKALLLILAAVQFANVMDFMILMPLSPTLKDALHITPSEFGTVVSSYTFSACVAGLLAALVIDRFDRRTALLALITGFSIGTLACGLADSYRLLMVARVATGAFGGVLGALIFAIIGDVFPAERRGAATGKVVSAFAVASVVGVPFGLFLSDRFGWQTPFYLLGGLGVAVGLFAFATMPSLRGHLGRVANRNPAAEVWELIVEPNHLRAFALMTAIMVGSFAVIPFLPNAIVFNGGIPKTSLLWLYVLGGACAFFSSPIIGRLADRFGKKLVYQIMAVFTIVPILLLTNLPRHISLWYAMAITAMLMVGNSGRMVPAVAMITASVEPRRRGGFMSVNSAVQHLAMSLGAFVAGKIVSQEGDGPLVGYAAVGWLAVAATAISLPLAGRLRSAKGGLGVAESVAEIA